MKRYFASPEAPALLEPHHQIVSCHIQDIRWRKILPLCRGAVGVFYSHSRLGCYQLVHIHWRGALPHCRDVVGVFYRPTANWAELFVLGMIM